MKHPQELRRTATPAEQKLWRLLRSSQFLNFKFRRQHPIDRYIVDFCCLEKRLVIEVDGDVHYVRDHAQRDELRTVALERLGFRVVRFTNLDVLMNPEGVLEMLLSVLAGAPSP